MTAWHARRQSFEQLAFEHMNELYGLALHLTRNRADAEDLVQDTCLRAYRHFDGFREGSNFRAWIFTVLRHTFITQQRRRRSRVTAVGMGAPGLHLEDPRSLEGLDARLDVAGGAMRAALGRLPEEYRLLLTLAYVEQFTYREIAAIVGRPVGTVMSRLFRARSRLRRELGPRRGVRSAAIAAPRSPSPGPPE
jgi:RNA polymerase sigma-70 factor (ECF subfamily)